MEFGFFIKKLLSFFVEPIGMILSLFVIGLYFLFIKREREAKYFLLLSFLALFLFSYPPFSNLLVKNLENKYSKYNYESNANYIVVLGSGHNADLTLPDSSRLSETGIKRVLEGILIHKHTEGSKLIFTGYTEISVALALSLGVNEEDIINAKGSRDTKGEAEVTKSIVKDEPFALVTSASHMKRAMELFTSFGLNPIAAPTDYRKLKHVNLFILPTVKSLDSSQRAMHEYIGLLWNLIRE